MKIISSAAEHQATCMVGYICVFSIGEPWGDSFEIFPGSWPHMLSTVVVSRHGIL